MRGGVDWKEGEGGRKDGGYFLGKGGRKNTRHVICDFERCTHFFILARRIKKESQR